MDNDELVEFVDYRSWLGQPSYDCAKGTKEIEKLICDDKYLSDRDGSISKTYLQSKSFKLIL